MASTGTNRDRTPSSGSSLPFATGSDATSACTGANPNMHAISEVTDALSSDSGSGDDQTVCLATCMTMPSPISVQT